MSALDTVFNNANGHIFLSTDYGDNWAQVGVGAGVNAVDAEKSSTAFSLQGSTDLQPPTTNLQPPTYN